MAATSLPEFQNQAEATVKEVFNYVIAQDNADYIGEAVSQLEHSLQAVQIASNSSAEWDIILGALLHDIGRFIHSSRKRCRE
jgi:2-amino-1-hydroxyethylphosphonate dioxygenase (glycine-forming)